MEPNDDAETPPEDGSLMEQAVSHFHEHLDAAFLSDDPSALGMTGAQRDWQDWPKMRVDARVELAASGGLVLRFSHGIYFALLDAAQGLALDPRFCADLPVDEAQIVALEEASADVRERFVDYSAATPGASLRFPILRTTLQDSRQHLTDVLLALGIKFIYLHELGHAYQGHLHFIRAHGGKLAWLEMAEAKMNGGMPAKIKPSDLRALELQADAFASHILIARNLESGPESLYPGSHVLRNAVDWILFASLAAVLVYALLERAELSTTLVSGVERRHPSVPVRLISLFAELKQVLLAQVESESERMAFMGRLLDECSVIFSLVGVDPIDVEGLNNYFASSWTAPETPVTREVRNYIARLRELSPTLTMLSDQARCDLKL